MLSYDWEKLLISAVNGVLWNMLCITTPQPVSMQLLSVSGSEISNVVFGMVHVLYPSFCTWQTAGQGITDISRVISFYAQELSPGQQGICGEQAAGPTHMQLIENSTQL